MNNIETNTHYFVIKNEIYSNWCHNFINNYDNKNGENSLLPFLLKILYDRDDVQVSIWDYEIDKSYIFQHKHLIDNLFIYINYKCVLSLIKKDNGTDCIIYDGAIEILKEMEKTNK